MMNGVAIAEGVISGALADQASHHLNRVTGQDEESGEKIDRVISHLRHIDEALNPSEAPNKDEPLLLQGYPSEYVTDAQNHGRAHLSIFFTVATAARFDIMGAGTYLKNCGPGWVQCDLPGNTRISTSDASSKAVIISYRVDPIGTPL